MAQSGVLRVPRVQLIRGLARTKKTANLSADSQQSLPQVSSTAGRHPGGKLIRTPGDGLGLHSWAFAKRAGWCAMNRGGEHGADCRSSERRASGSRVSVGADPTTAVHPLFLSPAEMPLIVS